MGKGGYVTFSEFARLIGISRQRVNYAANRGKVKFKLVDGIKMVEPKTAQEEWELAKTLRKSRNPSGKKKEKPKIVSAESPRYQGLTTADAERQEKLYKARLSELKYLEQAGDLVNIKNVKKQAFETARKVRDAVMSIPARVCHELAAETDPHILENQLAKELAQALEALARTKR